MENIFGVMQENALTALCFDEKGCQIIRNSIPIQAFSNSIYRKIAERAYAFYDAHKKPPRDHIADELQHELEGDSADLYEDTLHAMDRLKDSLNLEYVLGKLDEFNRIYAIRKYITESATALDAGDLPAAEAAISSYHVQRRYTEMEVFSLGDVRDVLMHHGQRDTVPLGIPKYDSNKIGPARKELFMFGGPAKSGKSWFLNHVSRCALFHGLKVLYITLEMSAPLVIMRMIQNLLSLPIKTGRIVDGEPNKGTMIHYPQMDKLETRSTTGKKIIEANFGVDYYSIPRKSILLPEMVVPIVAKLTKMGRYVNNFKVVERPTGSLTIGGLIAILDRLESTERFVPDLLVIDYVDLMKTDIKEYRLSVGGLYRDVRGLAVERNMAAVTATQLSRQSLTMVTRGAAQISEDYSKVMTCDQFLVYSQTQIENEMGLARLSVAASRHGNYNRDIVITQCYSVGQFVLESAPMSRNYLGQYYAELRRRMEANRGREEGDGEGEGEE